MTMESGLPLKIFYPGAFVRSREPRFEHCGFARIYDFQGDAYVEPQRLKN